MKNRTTEIIEMVGKTFTDGKITSFSFADDMLQMYTLDEYKQFEIKDYDRIFDYLESLYDETFVIESAKDLDKFKYPVDSIVLANGEDIINDVMFHRNELYFTNGGASAVKVSINVLKGATVTQRKGVK